MAPMMTRFTIFNPTVAGPVETEFMRCIRRKDYNNEMLFAFIRNQQCFSENPERL